SSTTSPTRSRLIAMDSPLFRFSHLPERLPEMIRISSWSLAALAPRMSRDDGASDGPLTSWGPRASVITRRFAMFRRSVAALAVLFIVVGLIGAGTYQGTITKLSDTEVTVLVKK